MLTRISPASIAVRRYPEKNDSSGISRRPDRPATCTLASRASNMGAASPMGEAVARLPPSVARLRMRGDAKSESHSRKNSGASVQARPMSVSEVRFNSQVRATGHQLRIWMGGEKSDALVHGGRTGKAVGGERGQFPCRCVQTLQKLRLRRLPQREGSVANGTGTGTAAQIPRQGHGIAGPYTAGTMLLCEQAHD